MNKIYIPAYYVSIKKAHCYDDRKPNDLRNTNFLNDKLRYNDFLGQINNACFVFFHILTELWLNQIIDQPKILK